MVDLSLGLKVISGPGDLDTRPLMIQRAFDVWVDPGMRDALRQRTRPEFDLSVQLYVVNREQFYGTVIIFRHPKTPDRRTHGCKFHKPRQELEGPLDPLTTAILDRFVQPGRISQAKFSFRHRGHRTGVHSGRSLHTEAKFNTSRRPLDPLTSKKTPGGAGTQTGHTRDTRAHTGTRITQTNLTHKAYMYM